MKNYFSVRLGGSANRGVAWLLLGAALFLACGLPAAAQKKKKNDTPPADSGPVVPMGDEQAIDYAISEMLGAWQLGDVERMHKDYADDVSIVNGIWAPPVFTWANYAPLYQALRARMQQVRMDRSHTYIKLNGNFAWACYQWDFSGMVDGQPSAARGQTTLIFEKRNGHWLIVHNHTSVAPTTQTTAPASTPQVTQPQPDKPSTR
ncbi:MAG TPA: nuclear transport factor 2 family protein [Candidatus Acidoferrum sp.]|jgi:ketosteroid isomerase-like protein